MLSARWQVFGAGVILVVVTCAVAMVASSSSSYWSATGRTGSEMLISPTAASTTEEIITFQRPDGGVIQLLQGTRARARLDELKAGHKRAGWLRAERNLMSRGLIATDIVTVIRHIPASEIIGDRDAVAIPMSMAAPQDFEESVDGKEIVMWSWDDGDDDTWEGAVQITRNSDGVYLTWDLQIEIPTAAGYDVGDWWDIDDYGSEEGSECPEDPEEGCPMEVNFSVPSSLRGDSHPNIVLVSENPVESQCPGPWCWAVVWVASDSGRRERVRQFSVCSGAALVAAGGSCIGSGAGWPACAAITGGFAVGGCGAYQLFDYLTGGEP